MERARRAALAALLLLAAAFAAAFIRTIVGTWHATSDHAVIEMRTLDVGGAHTPLLGPYSRYGWSHPGPALFYALAPALRLFGGHDIGLLAGAIFINALALACLFTVVWRRRDAAAFVAVVLVTAMLVRAVGGQSIFDPWNPYVIVLPLLAAGVCAWSAIDGHRWSLAASVVLASFVAQTHIGAAPVAVVIAGFALAWVAIETFRGDAERRRRGIRTIAIALAAGFVVWFPPILQAATSSGGNLRAIWDFWLSNHAVTGFAQGERLVAPQFAIPAPWMGAHEAVALGGSLAPSSNRFPVALILLAVVALFAFRRRDRDALALCSLAAVTAFTTWIAASRIVGTPYPYLLRWAWVAGAFTWIAIIVSLWRLLPPTWNTARIVTMTGAAAAACVIAALVVISAARTPYPVQVDSRALAQVERPVFTVLRHSKSPMLLESGPSLRSAGIATGLMVDASRAGIKTLLPQNLAYIVNSYRTLHGKAGTVLYVASDSEVARMLHNRSFRLIATYDSLSPSDRAELNKVLAYVDGRIQRLIELKRDHRRDYNRLFVLEAAGAHVAVFLRTGAT